MSLAGFLTKRYLKSKKDSRFISAISTITILGITLGVAVVIMALTILDGFQKVVSEKIVEFNSHIKVISFGNRNLPDPNEVVPEIQKQFGNEFVSIQPFVSKLAIAKSRHLTEGVTLIGIDPKSSGLHNDNLIRQGAFDLNDNDSTSKILLGEKLAEKMFVKVGDKITVFGLRNDQAPSMDNPPSIVQFRVAGIYESGLSEYDDLNAFINISTAQNIFGIGSQISGYNIKVKDIGKLKTLSDELQDFLGYPYYVRTIFQVHQNIFTWLDLQKKPIPIVLGLIIFVAVFNIVGTLLMLVLERTKAIGILRSIGGNRKLIMKIFLYHAVYLTVIGIAAGNILAFIMSYLQEKFDIISLPGTVYFVTKVPIAISGDNYLLVSGVTLVIALGASLLPAFIASRIKPISAIRFD
ncbi:MAG: ABC transporter permease [Bacteroidota bacterium]